MKSTKALNWHASKNQLLKIPRLWYSSCQTLVSRPVALVTFSSHLQKTPKLWWGLFALTGVALVRAKVNVVCFVQMVDLSKITGTLLTQSQIYSVLHLIFLRSWYLMASDLSMQLISAPRDLATLPLQSVLHRGTGLLQSLLVSAWIWWRQRFICRK